MLHTFSSGSAGTNPCFTSPRNLRPGSSRAISRVARARRNISKTYASGHGGHLMLLDAPLRRLRVDAGRNEVRLDPCKMLDPRGADGPGNLRSGDRGGAVRPSLGRPIEDHAEKSAAIALILPRHARCTKNSAEIPLFSHLRSSKNTQTAQEIKIFPGSSELFRLMIKTFLEKLT